MPGLLLVVSHKRWVRQSSSTSFGGSLQRLVMNEVLILCLPLYAECGYRYRDASLHEVAYRDSRLTVVVSISSVRSHSWPSKGDRVTRVSRRREVGGRGLQFVGAVHEFLVKLLQIRIEAGCC